MLKFASYGFLHLLFTRGISGSNNIRLLPLAFEAKLLLFFISLLVQLPGFAQNTIVQDKIDPVFRAMINLENERSINSRAALPPQYRIEATEGVIPIGAPVEKRYECIVYTKDAVVLRERGITINTVMSKFVTAWASLNQIVQMSLMPGVSYIDAPETEYLHNDIAIGGTGASLLHQGRLSNTVYKGKNVIVAIYDSGIDWDHFDFRDPNDTTKSRILRIWDQTITAIAGEAPPSGFSYGVEYTQNQINNEIDGSPANIVRERDTNGHGTHVAGTAAGNGASLPSKRYTGMAPEADIVVIKGGNGSFSESRMIDGLTYLKNLATSLGKTAVLNWSIGGQSGAHDGSRAYEVAVDSFSSVPGRLVVISAGNDNNSNIHNRINIAANGTGSTLISVSDTTSTDVFDYRIYANDSSNITATITAPGGETLSANAGQSTSLKMLSDSFTVYLTNRIDPNNSDRYIDVYLARSDTNTRRPTGIWTLSLTNNTTNTLTMDGWLYYKNAAFSATNIVGGNSDYIVASPGNASSAITAASFIGKNNWYSNAVPNAYTFSASRIDSISGFSSRGPRRDGVLKPDIAAHGEVVVSCLSSNATASFANSSIVETGLYVKNQGTSMAAPGVTGAVALLLQMKPTATSSEIKGYLTTAANKDAMTELLAPTPNATWGYGKLDVFKAASLLFNCAPADRRTYKYDSSTRNGQETGTTFNTHRMALKFTPDINGKLGGVFFHTSTTSTALFAEVRTNNSGNPGDLLGTVNIDSARIGRYAFNYIDLSNLGISVSTGTDYFIVLARAATSIANWSLRGETLSLDGRTLQSTNAGVSWNLFATDYKIRPVVYSNGQTAGTIATITSTDTRNPNASNQFINTNCQLISQLVPNGLNPVAGAVVSKVWVESSVPHYLANPYVQRHYEITPPADAPTATGKLTLYFTQDEFTAFNNDPLSIYNLPTAPADAVGISNLRIGKYSGTSSDNTGSPGTYDAPAPVIDPADGDIVWNTAANRWEVSFDVTGFSGFIVQSIPTVLPIVFEYFKGNIQDKSNILNWKINCVSNTAVFEVERSDNANSFSNLSTLATTMVNCSHPFTFKDASPLTGANYYRIKIVENTGRTTYTNTILLQNGSEISSRLYPTVIRKGAPVQVSFSGKKGMLVVYDAVGKQVLSRLLSNGVESLNLGLAGNQVYFYNIKDEKRIVASGKIIVQ